MTSLHTPDRMTADDSQGHDKGQKRRIVISAVIMAGVAIGFYVGFIAYMAAQ